MSERMVEERRGSEWALKVMWWIPMDVWRSECNNCLSHMHNGPLKCMGNSLSKSTRRFFIFIYIDKTNTPIEHDATVALLFYGSTYFISLFPYLSHSHSLSPFQCWWCTQRVVLLFLVCLCICVHSEPKKEVLWCQQIEMTEKRAKEKQTQESSVGDFILYISVNK